MRLPPPGRAPISQAWPPGLGGAIRDDLEALRAGAEAAMTGGATGEWEERYEREARLVLSKIAWWRDLYDRYHRRPYFHGRRQRALLFVLSVLGLAAAFRISYDLNHAEIIDAVVVFLISAVPLGLVLSLATYANEWLLTWDPAESGGPRRRENGRFEEDSSVSHPGRTLGPDEGATDL
ncbi:hypothetical protein [Kitasatospora albolonga]|uniref:hypothetical protein n=1 Tax=Kitasatospora albolonga TaxID=68173 RepID=UPI0035ED7554